MIRPLPLDTPRNWTAVFLPSLTPDSKIRARRKQTMQKTVWYARDWEKIASEIRRREKKRGSRRPLADALTELALEGWTPETPL